VPPWEEELDHPRGATEDGPDDRGAWPYGYLDDDAAADDAGERATDAAAADDAGARAADAAAADDAGVHAADAAVPHARRRLPPGCLGFAAQLVALRPEHEELRAAVFVPLLKDVMVFSSGADVRAHERVCAARAQLLRARDPAGAVPPAPRCCALDGDDSVLAAAYDAARRRTDGGENAAAAAAAAAGCLALPVGAHRPPFGGDVSPRGHLERTRACALRVQQALAHLQYGM
jgi:hypothetical protein